MKEHWDNISNPIRVITKRFLRGAAKIGPRPMLTGACMAPIQHLVAGADGFRRMGPLSTLILSLV